MNYIEDLIIRMSDDSLLPGEKLSAGTLYDSSKTISSAAHNEARNLKDPKYIDELEQLLKSEKNKEKRKNIILILGYLAKNVGKNEVANTLIESLKTEKDRFTIIALLNRIEELFKNSSVDLTPIHKLFDHKNWHIRSAAYSGITNTENKVEEMLTNKLKTVTDKTDILYLLRALSKVGTQKSLDAVTHFLKHRSRDVKDSAQTTITIIMLREGFSNSEIQQKTKLTDNIISYYKRSLDKHSVPG
ncbi:MAG: HEAT repeat domain-containing protein [Bacteroidia bacterium]